jgi:hypothetical protein
VSDKGSSEPLVKFKVLCVQLITLDLNK